MGELKEDQTNVDIAEQIDIELQRTIKDGRFICIVNSFSYLSILLGDRLRHRTLATQDAPQTQAEINMKEVQCRGYNGKSYLHLYFTYCY